MPALLTLDAVCAKTPDGRPLFDNLTLSFGAERTGIVGRNGAGKTTLARVMAGDLAPAAGVVAVNARIGVLRQRIGLDGHATVADLMGVAGPLARLARIEAGRGDDADFAEADWTLETRLGEALAQVGMERVDLGRPAGSLSGGQATRVALAGLIALAPDLILLDEPTNNLDVPARGLVAELIGGWRGGVVVISHDRDLLRRMDRIVELSAVGARVYGGGYDLFVERKAEEAAAAVRDLEAAERDATRVARENQTARERQARRDAAGRRFAARRSEPKILLGRMAERAENSAGRGQALAERQAAEAQEKLLAAKGRVERARSLAFDLPSTGLPAGRVVLEMDRVAFAYPGGGGSLRDISLRIAGPERVAIEGANGAGKSTLLRLVLGALEPAAGRVVRGVPGVMLDQHAALLGEGETLVEAFRRINPEAGDNAARAALARFLFRNVAADKRVAALSGGERLRAALACVTMGAAPPQFLVLDEPTNHLDLDSIAAVEAALAAYDGALLVVSHDSDFLAEIGIERRVRLS